MSRVQTPDAPKRRRGAPKGNRNAVGNSGGAPKGNRNAFKHGGYAAVHWDTLTDEERALIAGASHDCETLLREEIRLLSIMERRVMARINACGESLEGLFTAETIRGEEMTEFESPEDEALYRRVRLENAELPGHAYTLATRMEAALNVILRLEESLTRFQAMKQRCIRSLIKLRRSRSDGAEVDEAVRREVESAVSGTPTA